MGEAQGQKIGVSSRREDVAFRWGSVGEAPA